jgi:hypothetical protein
VTVRRAHPSTEALPQLAFGVESARAVRYAASPTVAFDLAITSDKPVRSLALNAQIRIVPTRRSYDDGDQQRLVELFGVPERWGETLRGFLWTNTTTMVPPFDETTRVVLEVACTYDLEVAAAKYFYALRHGDVPLEFLFSGTIFYLGDGGLLRTARVPWECEAEFRLPVTVWKEAIENCFPGTAWLRLRSDVFQRLAAYKARRSLPTWEATIDELLES